MMLQSLLPTVLFLTAPYVESTLQAATAPRVDLGYAVYEGSYDVNNSINVFKGSVLINWPVTGTEC